MRAADWISVFASLVPALGYGADGAEFFEAKVRPLLAARCFECHSHEKKIKGGLALDSRSGWEKGGDSGPALIPEKPDESLLIKAVTYADADVQMPPKKKLSDDEIAVLAEWVKMGAPDPRESATAKRRGVNLEEARKHWAFQPIVKTDVPAAAIDALIGAKLTANRLTPAPPADPYTWLRRVNLDLTGLPPTPPEIEAFVNDPSPDARARVIDRLLASGGFGERWARHWLDLVGYADQIGTANNVPAVHAWRYRDYVIRAFNADKPFDEFIREQIAGDLLTAEVAEGTSGGRRVGEPTSPAQRQDQITATGFLVLGNINIVEADKDKLRVDVVDQQIEKIGKTFLGQTLQCARCHDHKFDPIAQREYYGLAGIFMSTESVYLTGRGVWSSVTFAELPPTEHDRELLAGRLREHEKLVTDVKFKITAAKQQSRSLADQADVLKMDPDSTERDALVAEKAKADKTANDHENRLRHLEYIQPGAERTFAVREAKQPADTPITIRGNPHAPGEVVPRGFVQAAFRGAAPEIPRDQSGRLQLVTWVTSPENTLTSRVLVNRLWQKLFGEGLVRSVDYFGLRGEPPSHPELLDHLAARFMSDGWSQKRLIREIVLSDTYARASRGVTDPENRLLARQNRFRLDAEVIRDAALAISGDLVASDGGPALALEYPENVNGLDARSVNPVAFSVARFRPEQSRQRTIYLPVVRSSVQKGPGEILDIFDFAQPAQFLGRRPVTTVPPQALYLMNGPLLKAQAAKLAATLLKTDGDDHARLSDLYLRVLNRPVNDEESAEALAFLASPGQREESWTALCHALLTCNEFLFRL